MTDIKHSKEVLVSKFSEQHFKKFIKRIDKSLISLISEYTEIFSSDSLTPSILGPRLEVDRNQSVIQSKIKKQYKPQVVNKKTFIEKPFRESGYAPDLEVKCWFYKDESEEIKGPFNTTEMDILIHKGQVKAYTLVSFKNNDEFFPVMKMITEINKRKNPEIFKNKGTYVSYKGRNLKEDEGKPPIQLLGEESKAQALESLLRALEKDVPEKEVPVIAPIAKVKPHYWFTNEENNLQEEQIDIPENKFENEPIQQIKVEIAETKPIIKEEVENLETINPREKSPEPIKEPIKELAAEIEIILKKETPKDVKVVEKSKSKQKGKDKKKPEPNINEVKTLEQILQENILESKVDAKEFLIESSESEDEDEDEWLQVSSNNTKKKNQKKENSSLGNVVGLLPKKASKIEAPVESKVKPTNQKISVTKDSSKIPVKEVKVEKPIIKEDIPAKKIESEEDQESSEDDGWIATVNTKSKSIKKSDPKEEKSLITMTRNNSQPAPKSEAQPKEEPILPKSQVTSKSQNIIDSKSNQIQEFPVLNKDKVSEENQNGNQEDSEWITTESKKKKKPVPKQKKPEEEFPSLK